jgi:hypothetical protein
MSGGNLCQLRRTVLRVGGILILMKRPGPILPPTPERINGLPKWAREYIHYVDTFVGAQEVREIFYLRDQKRASRATCCEQEATRRKNRR